MNPEKTGAFIAELRKQKNMTQKDLAKKLGVTDKAISRWETGKGYPDIESLPALASALSVSLNELLNGEPIVQEQTAYVSNVNLEYVCNTAMQNLKKYKKKIIAIVAVFLSIIIFLSGLLIAMQVHYQAEYLIGSDNCIVAEDYSYILYYDKKYVPLETGYIAKSIPSEAGTFDCELGEESVYEVRVEGKGFLDKMLFGECLYSVKGAPDDDIIYLYTDYDLLSTQYYVKEDKHEYYSEILDNAVTTEYYAQIEQKDWNYKNVQLTETVLEAILKAEKNEPDTSTDSTGEVWIPVHAFEENHIFYQSQGEILYKNEKYYWYPYHGLPDYSSHPYPIDEAYYKDLDKLFSYMYQ